MDSAHFVEAFGAFSQGQSATETQAQDAKASKAPKGSGPATFNIAADSLTLPPGLGHIRMWPGSGHDQHHLHHAHSEPVSPGGQLLHLWDAMDQGKPESMHAEHELGLMLPVTPNSERIMNGVTASAAGDHAATSSTPFMAEMAGFSAAHDAHHVSAFTSMPMLMDDTFMPPHFSPQGLMEPVQQAAGLAPRSHHSMPSLHHHLHFEELPQAEAPAGFHQSSAQAQSSRVFARRYSQPAALSGERVSISPADSLSEEDQPSRKRKRGKGVRRLTCTNCATHQTPQWRCGPQGPRTLCNACGVRYKKGLPMEGIIAAAAAMQH